MSTSNGCVLLTGINGFIAVHITKILLAKGYSVVGTIRSPSKADYIKTLFKNESEAGKLDFAVVDDITKDGAFDEVLKSKPFVAVLHTSSPFSLKVENPERDLLIPAIKGTKGILSSIHKHAPSVKRVVVISSFASCVNGSMGNWPEHVYTEKDWNPITYEKGTENGGAGYYASKKLAEESAWDFMKEFKPKFSLTTLCPPMVFGPPEQEVTSLANLNTSAAGMYDVFTGKEQPRNSVYIWVDVRDIALAHVLAIESDAAANQRYLITAGSYSAQQFVDYIWKHYPERAQEKGVAKGTPGKLYPDGGVYTADNSKSLRDLSGLEYHSFDDMCHATFERFLVLEKEGK
ncbi:methylglyoxal reductase (NADPH-dependent) gre2 [Tulasnella sp. JGI-2019a]|nr:methylglyoxal reductase (NADPH-dependent) gre2 [Tulasnella sp. JGI-2019a]KAG9010857.1 methylglyoxal reductase (NADPH-dependent) gre2 [Tulasnella sp. JGI-2019a]KAG9037700.1 methylglyoxal reductase (NADPH-dependent) gre2 [Tulasnella sp. JGI-2019a]